VLYEAATGVLPFQGGSPISTLMARVGMPLPHHPALGALDQMLARAAAPDPEARMDAAGLADRLDALASSLDQPEPLNPSRRVQPTYVVAPPTVTVKSSFETSETQVTQSPTGTTTAVGSKTLASGTIGFRSPSASELTGAVPVAATSALLANARPAAGSEGSGGDGAAGESEAGFEFDEERRRRRWWIWVVSAIVLVLIAGAGIALAGGLNKAEVTVPSVVGSTKAQAVDQIQAAKLTVGYGKGSYSTSVPKDQVLSQSPGGGTKASEGHEVMLTLSLGPPLVTVPAVLGQSCTAAEAALTAAKLSSSCPTAAATYSATVPPGKVVSYMVNGTVNAPAVPEGSVVILSVSSGSAPTAVPDVSGLSYLDAGNKLRAAGFSVAEGSEYSSTVPVSSVTRTTPPAGAALSAGGLVTVYVSNGPAPVTVPNLVGDTAAQAVKALTDLGLSPNIIGSGSTVMTQDPVAGTVVPAGTTVTVTLA
ncbi:MAG: PASTA domain-containing protein, partial [Actinomycetota bacterium]